MCGITGKVYFTSKKQITDRDIHAMNQKIAHRGPDDEGIYINKRKNVGFGHRRLSIIDLSPDGHQPMSNEDGSVWIVFNGEIYNFQSLRPDLERRGHKFKSQSDTEVIIHLWEEYGEACLSYLRGMFAFAVWDEKKQKLFLARDRSGQKPLKYYLDENCFVFGSELKAFLHDPDVPRETDFEALHHYLTFQYVPAPMTGFKHIKKLPAAHYLSLDLSGPTPKINGPIRYWRLDYSQKLILSEDEWKERLLEKLDESVKLRMVADVPIGAFLSGGIDSSLIVALMAKHSRQPVRTFSIGFKEETHNELPYARLIANQFKTNHTEFIVSPDAIQIIPELVYHYEEPYADSSAIPTYYVSQLTRQHVTIALNGDGGDENFAGYGRYNVHQFAVRYQMIPSSVRKTIELGALLSSKLFQTTFFDRCKRFTKSINQPYERYYLECICYFNTLQKSDIYSEKFKKETASSFQTSDTILQRRFDDSDTQNPLDRVLYADFTSYLPDDLLVKVDIATMATGLEGRSPFLDHEFLELTAKIPSSLKIKNGEKKYILKKAIEHLLPNEIIYRKKQGFGVPIEHWFRADLKEYAHDTLLSNRAVSRGIFDEKEVRKILSLHNTTKINYANHIWALLTLEHWFQKFFD